MNEMKHNPWQSQASQLFCEFSLQLHHDFALVTDAQNFHLSFVGFCGRWNRYVTGMS